MKILIASDIHGSSYYAKILKEKIKKENVDEVILLGDLYYHGPRNPLPKEYNPMVVSNILNTLSIPLKVIRGNCDALVDEEISNFSFRDYLLLNINNKKIYLTHGHKINIDNLPKEDIDILIYGHFHTGFIKKDKNLIYANPGSISLPKENTKHSYMILDDNYLILKDIDGNIIDKLNYKGEENE